jgi:hypothetical protein
MTRTAHEVLEDHLRRRSEGDLEGDLRENYHPDVVVLTAKHVKRGHDGVRESAHLLWQAVADGGDYRYDSVLADDRMALLEWRAKTEEIRVSAGVDSYLIEDGLITAQTIHYRVENLELSVSAESLSQPGATGPSSQDDSARLHHMVDS